MGKKYIIEIPEDKITDFVGSTHFLMPYMMAGHIGHHDTGLPIKPYAEPDLGALAKENFERGYRQRKAEDEKEIQEAYQRGLSDAWETARKICANWCISDDDLALIFGKGKTIDDIMREFTATEAIEKIRQYEQEKEQYFTTEEVMRQYLDTFCKGRSCTNCLLCTPDFTCGRGKHFLHNCVSDEEVRRAYAAVLAKMKES